MGKLRGVEARVDFIAVRDLSAKLAAEAEARKGHDVVEVRFFTGALYRANLAPLGDGAGDLEKTAGPWLDIAKYVGFVGGEWVSIPWYYYNIPQKSIWNTGVRSASVRRTWPN